MSVANIEIAETPLMLYALRRADDALILGHRLSEWCGHAPVLEEDLALGNLGLDLIGQARTLYTYAGEVEGRGRGEDALAYLRDARELRNILLVEQPNGDFAATMMRQLIYAAFAHPYFEALAGSLGADGAACLWGAPAIAEGRGERLSAAPGLPPLDAVLVNPRTPVSTAEVYRRFDADGRFGDVSPPTEPETFEDATELAAWLVGQRNDLEAAAIAVSPVVGSVLETLAGEPEALLARVSGSGGTCFALCASDIEAESLAERIEGMAPGWWVRRCRLGGPWPDPA